MIASINHKSEIVEQLKKILKLLKDAIQIQICEIKAKITKRWLIDSGSPQKGQSNEPGQPPLAIFVLVSILFFLTSHKKILILKVFCISK